jgi:hypothetical protein
VKRVLAVLLVLTAPFVLFAQAPGGMGPWQQQFGMQFQLVEILRSAQAGPYLSAEIMQIQSDLAQQKIGDTDFATVFSVRERLSVASQKDDYVRDMERRSYFLPGLGQLEMGDTGSGIGFMALDLAVWAGTLVGVYYTLPDDLRFDHIDYFRSSFSGISSAWNNHSIVDYLPAFGVFVGGVIVDQIVRHWSSGSAKDEAKNRIDSGAVKFTPRVGIGALGFNIAY